MICFSINSSGVDRLLIRRPNSFATLVIFRPDNVAFLRDIESIIKLANIGVELPPQISYSVAPFYLSNDGIYPTSNSGNDIILSVDALSIQCVVAGRDVMREMSDLCAVKVR